MATFVQSQSNFNSSTGPLSITWSSNTSTGNYIMVFVQSGMGNATNVSSITDSQGNTYTRIGGSNANVFDLEIWHAKNITGGTTPTVTVNLTANRDVMAIIREYSGVDTVNPVDVSSFGNTGSSTTPTSASVATNFTNETIVGFAYTNQSPISWTLGTGFSNLQTVQDNSAVFSMATEDKVVTSTGNYTAPFTMDISGSWEADIVALKDASQATTTSTSSTSTSSTSVSTSSTSTSTSSTSTSTTVSLTTSTSSTSVSTSSSSTSTSTSTTLIDISFISPTLRPDIPRHNTKLFVPRVKIPISR